MRRARVQPRTARRPRSWGAIGLRLLFLGLALFTVLGLVLRWLVVEPACIELAPVDLGLSELAGLKRRLQAYQAAGPDAALLLDDREATYLLREVEGLVIEITFQDSLFEALFCVERSGSCVNIRMDGLFEVRDGMIVFEPYEVQVGALDLSPLMGGRRFQFTPDQLVAPRMARVIRNVSSADVRGDFLEVRLRDRERW